MHLRHERPGSVKLHGTNFLFIIGILLFSAPATSRAQVFQSLSQSLPIQSQFDQGLVINTHHRGAASHCCEPDDFEAGTLLAFLGIDGSKQPQDFGVNANIGIAGSLGYSAPLLACHGIGFQIGTRANFSGNAVQVYELLGESHDRFQSFTTVGAFQRLDNGISFGAAYDFLSQESFDNFSLGQWRVKASIDISPISELGVTLNFSDRKDTGMFNEIPVELESVEQLHIYLKRQWQSGVQTSFWIGVADGHGEENVVTGTLPRKTNQILFGAEIHAPLNQWLAIYGQTNLVMPADTGAVDAFLGIQFAPQGIARSRSRRNRFREFLPVASNASFTTDLTRQ